jgi:hypothetical protein
VLTLVHNGIQAITRFLDDLPWRSDYATPWSLPLGQVQDAPLLRNTLDRLDLTKP